MQKKRVAPAYDSKRRLVHQNASLTLICADVTAMALALVSAKQTVLFFKNAFFINFYEGSGLLPSVYIHDFLYIILFTLVLLYFLAKGHYTQRIPWWSQVQNIIKACAIAFIFDGFSRFALDMSVSRLMIVLMWVYLGLFIIFCRQITFIFLRKQKIWNIPVLAIGDIDTLTNLLFACHTDRYTGYNIKTVVLRDQPEKEFDLETLPSRYKNLEVLRDAGDYEALIRTNSEKFFIVSLETFRGTDRELVINALNEADMLYAVLPPSTRINSYEMEPRYFFGYDIMLLHNRSAILSPLGRTVKRLMDVSAAALALIILALPMLIVAISLKLEGQGGSVFYGGKRIGRHGKKFKCWKFRSMEPDSDHLLHALLDQDPQAKSDWEMYRKLKQPDPRITTRTARIIRKTSIDELPQLWNVLVGDMSLVGPRPILEDEVELFGDSINDYLKVRPGITGLWQVSGRNDTSFQRRVYWDSWYVRNWSIWGDIVILIKTLGVVFGGRGAF